MYARDEGCAEPDAADLRRLGEHMDGRHPEASPGMLSPTMATEASIALCKVLTLRFPGVGLHEGTFRVKHGNTGKELQFEDEKVEGMISAPQTSLSNH